GLDRLAAESFVLDGASIDSPALEALYRSYWLGSHALARAGGSDNDAGRIVDPSCALPQLLAAAGVSAALLTDAAEVAGHPLAALFDQLQLIQVSAGWPNGAAAEIEDTQTGKF